MSDPNLNRALRWGIQNSDASRDGSSAPPPPLSTADMEAFTAVFSSGNFESEPVQMVNNLGVIENPQAEAEDKYTALDNFELLVSNLDNANTMENNNMWTRMIKQLDMEDPEIRKGAAACCGTAVQNNNRSQQRLLICDGIPVLVRLATTDTDRNVRKKAIFAISSTVRNFQPGLDAVLSHMPPEYKPEQTLDANDMESVDLLINKLRESI